MATLFNLISAIQFTRKLATPIVDTDAYKLGIINAKGQRTKLPLKTTKEKNAWQYIDIITNNLKKIMASVGASGRIATVAAALLLLREEIITEENYCLLYDQLCKQLVEDGEGAPVNNAGGGNIAGIGVNSPSGKPDNFAEPPVRKKAMNKYKVGNKKDAEKLHSVILGMIKRN